MEPRVPLDKRLALMITSEMDAQLREYAQHNGVAIADVVRHAVQQLLLETAPRKRKKSAKA
jgi:hypothetical protein